MQIMLLQNWVHGKGPVKGLGDFVLQKLRHFDICNTLFCL